MQSAQGRLLWWGDTEQRPEGSKGGSPADYREQRIQTVGTVRTKLLSRCVLKRNVREGCGGQGRWGSGIPMTQTHAQHPCWAVRLGRNTEKQSPPTRIPLVTQDSETWQNYLRWRKNKYKTSYQGKCRGVRRDPYGLGASEKKHHRKKGKCSLTLKNGRMQVEKRGEGLLSTQHRAWHTGDTPWMWVAHNECSHQQRGKQWEIK